MREATDARAFITSVLRARCDLDLAGQDFDASEPLPTPLGTLNALHLATALVWRDRLNTPLIVCTHDVALAVAARAFGFDVRGA